VQTLHSEAAVLESELKSLADAIGEGKSKDGA
jgi:hypothetical protein